MWVCRDNWWIWSSQCLWNSLPVLSFSIFTKNYCIILQWNSTFLFSLNLHVMYDSVTIQLSLVPILSSCYISAPGPCSPHRCCLDSPGQRLAARRFRCDPRYGDRSQQFVGPQSFRRARGNKHWNKICRSVIINIVHTFEKIENKETQSNQLYTGLLIASQYCAWSEREIII